MTSITGDAPLPVVRDLDSLRAVVAAWRAQGLRIGLVPTMGALHAGHTSLVALAKARCDRVIATVFVNPTQFGPNEDFASYPRDEAADAAKLADAGADLMYAPQLESMYPAGFSTVVSVAGVTDGLCGATRPGHFAGVTTVVTKLLNRVQPDLAVFGEKDYQQLLTLKRLAADLDLPVEVVGGPIVREADGLAMSSRNAYLTAGERAVAPELNRTLRRAAADMLGGAEVDDCLDWARGELLARGFAGVDYVELRDAETLEPLAELGDRPARLLAAAHLGRARLLDNIAVDP